DLSCEEDGRPRPQLQSWRKKRRRVDVRIPVNLAKTEKLSMFEARNHAQDARLLAELQVILKADKIVTVGAQIFLPQLHHRVRPPSGPRIHQSHGLHRPKAERVAAAPC